VAIEHKRLGKHGVLVSNICLGTMNFGWHTPQKESFKIMDRALELGINFFDTADVYGWGGEQGDTRLGHTFSTSAGRSMSGPSPNSCLYLMGVHMTWPHVFFAIVVLLMVTAQVPYVFGQMSTHEFLLGELQGIEREELRSDIRKHAPLSPGSDAWLACTSGGTVGALAVKLMDNMLPKS
jgi:hypothetical protein